MIDQKPDNKIRFQKSIFVAIAAFGGLQLLGGVWPYIIQLVYQIREKLGGAGFLVDMIGDLGDVEAMMASNQSLTTYLFAVVCLVVGVVGFTRVNRK